MEIRLRSRPLGALVQNPAHRVWAIFPNPRITRHAFREAFDDLGRNDEVLKRYEHYPFVTRFTDMTIAVNGTNGFVRFASLERRDDLNRLYGMQADQIFYDLITDPQLCAFIRSRIRSK